LLSQEAVDLGAKSMFVRDALMEIAIDETKEKGGRKFIGEEGNIIAHAWDWNITGTCIDR
jgi:hypothetical protein